MVVHKKMEFQSKHIIMYDDKRFIYRKRKVISHGKGKINEQKGGE